MMDRFIRLYFLFAFLFVGNTIKAQTDVVYGTEVSKTALIQNDRDLLLDKIVSDNVEGVAYYRNALLNQENKDYASFSIYEKLLLNYYFKEYADVKVEVITYELKQLAGSQKIYPKKDYLVVKLLEKSKQNRARVIKDIYASELSDLDKQFLILNFDYLISGDENDSINQDYLNEKSNIYLTNYPNSQYEEFVRKYIKYQLVPSKWGFGFEFFLGYGAFTQEIADNFSNQGAFGITFDVAYKKTTFYFRGYLGVGRLNKPIASPNRDLIWEEGSRATLVKPEFSVGYDFYETEKIKFTPFVGISAALLESGETDDIENSSFKDSEIDYASAYELGLNLDWKIGKDKMNLITNKASNSYWFLRFRYSLSVPDIHVNGAGLNGVYHCVTIGIGGFARGIKRAN